MNTVSLGQDLRVFKLGIFLKMLEETTSYLRKVNVIVYACLSCWLLEQDCDIRAADWWESNFLWCIGIENHVRVE